MPTTVAEIIKERRRRIMLNGQFDDFGWLLGEDEKCCECGRNIDVTAIMSVDLCLNGAHFGDLACCILCPHCDSLYYLHARKWFLDGIMTAESKPMVRREGLVSSGVNNLLEITEEELEAIE